MVGNAIMPPIAAPELNMPCAKARSLVGNHSAFPLAAPGQFPASATPNNERKMERLTTPFAKAWSAVAKDQNPMDKVKPILVPTLSKIFPKMACPKAYEKMKKVEINA